MALPAKLLSSWGQNRFLEPHGLRVDRHDNVWVTDRALQQVFEFSHDGKLLLTIGTSALRVWMPLISTCPPTSLRCRWQHLRERRLRQQSRCQILSGWKVSARWGKKGSEPGEFNLPHSVAVMRKDSSTSPDRSNSRIQVFDGQTANF